MKVQNYLSFLLISVLFTGPQAHAELISAADINIGTTTLNMKTANNSSSVSDISSIEVNYLLKHSGTPIAYVLSFGELLRSQDVSLPYTRLGAGVRYYPLGFNGSRMILDQEVTAQVWRATPFVGLILGIANVTVTDYNASLIEMSPRFGVELPLTTNVLLQVQMSLLSGTATGSISREVSYDGVTGLVGVILTGL